MFQLYGINKPMMEEIGTTIPERRLCIIIYMALVQQHTMNHPSHPNLLITRELVSSSVTEVHQNRFSQSSDIAYI